MTRYLGGRYTRPGTPGPPGERGTPGVLAEPQPDGSLVITATETTAEEPVPAVAVAIPTPPAEGLWALRAEDGVVMWVAVLNAGGTGP